PPEKSADYLADRSKELASRLGGVAEPADSAWWFAEQDNGEEILHKIPAPDRYRKIASLYPGILRFGYRQSPRPLGSASTSVRRQAPAPYFSDEISMTLDMQGRLLYFSKISPEKLGPASSSPAPNWSGFWDAADLDATALTPVAPTWMPDVGADQLFSWKG